MPTIKQLKARQTKRSRKARAVDSRATAKRTYSIANKKGLRSWMKRPGKSDASGIDTKGKGFDITVSIRPSDARRRKRSR